MGSKTEQKKTTIITHPSVFSEAQKKKNIVNFVFFQHYYTTT